MRPILVGMAAVAVGAMVAVQLYTSNMRYSLVTGSDGIAYKLDRKTGQTVMVVGPREFSVEKEGTQSEIEAPGAKALRLAKAAMSMGTFSNELEIKEQMKKVRGEVRIVGWQTRVVEENLFVVSYSYWKAGNKMIGWAFEVNTEEELVRKINGDEELGKKYGWTDLESVQPRPEITPQLTNNATTHSDVARRLQATRVRVASEALEAATHDDRVDTALVRAYVEQCGLQFDRAMRETVDRAAAARGTK